MKEETKAIIRYRLNRAKESLKDASKLLNEGSLHSSVNRIYYAMFYSVNAPLLTRDLSSSKHSGARSLFFKEFITGGEVDRQYGKFYSEISEKRQTGDYEDLIEFKREDIEVWLKKAEEFVNQVETLTNRLMREGN
jgi:uncharacterized protein (UPF0332 family)